MSKWKQGFSLVLAAVFSTTLLGGCSGGSKGSQETPSSNASASADSGAGSVQPLTIKWLSFNPPDKDGNAVQKYLENRFNVKIENMRIDRSNWNDQLNIKLAGGDVPDVFWLWDANDIMLYSQQGVLAELPTEEIKENMPKYAETVDQQDDKLWKYGMIDGKSYAIPLYWSVGSQPYVPGYNGKWLKAIGYSEPPTTLEELEDVFTKFTNDDPDGDGKKDTYGISAVGKGAIGIAFNAVFGAYGTKWNTWIKDKDGTLVNSMTTEPVKEAMTTLNKWYKKGIVDPEFITNDWNKYRQAFYNGKIGETETDWRYYYPTGLVYQELKKVDPDNEIITGKPVHGPYGEGVAHAFGVKNSYIGMGAQVAKDEKKKKKIYEILEALATDDEAYLMSYYGEEGTNYTLEDGAVVMKTEFAPEANRGSYGGGTFYGFFGSGKSSLMKDFDFTKEQQDFAHKLGDGVQTLVDAKLFNVPAEKDYPDLPKMTDEYFIKFITGELNPATDYDKFIDKWKKTGGEQITEQVNQKYTEMK